jgi:cytochrome c
LLLLDLYIYNRNKIKIKYSREYNMKLYLVIITLFLIVPCATYGLDQQEEQLFQAIRSNNTKLLKKLIEQGADVNVVNRIGSPTGGTIAMTPLIAAIQKNKPGLVKLLLEHGANPNQGPGVSPLFVAIDMGNLENVKLLVEYGADVHQSRQFGAPGGMLINQTPLSAAKMKNDTEIVEFLQEKGAK